MLIEEAAFHIHRTVGEDNIGTDYLIPLQDRYDTKKEIRLMKWK